MVNMQRELNDLRYRTHDMYSAYNDYQMMKEGRANLMDHANDDLSMQAMVHNEMASARH